jgi:two-component sensor histidine kinase
MRARSLGLQLVTNLARQLDAEFTRDAVDRGTSFTIRFRTPPAGHTAAAPTDAEP